MMKHYHMGASINYVDKEGGGRVAKCQQYYYVVKLSTKGEYVNVVSEWPLMHFLAAHQVRFISNHEQKWFKSRFSLLSQHSNLNFFLPRIG